MRKPMRPADQAPGSVRGSDRNHLFHRRLFVALAVVSTIAAMCMLMVATLSRGGFGALDLALTVCFVVTLPWTTVGFWNALIGLLIMRVCVDPALAVCPVAAAPTDKTAINSRTAVLMCIRNEDAETVARNLDMLLEGLSVSGLAERFHLYVLSDSSLDQVIAEEEAVFARLEDRWRGIFPVVYRRRKKNTGFKAGNIRDFCRRWGRRYDYALVLDADSLMSAAAVVRMVRSMQNNPQLGILQGLVVGMPTASPFARVFQFGMRLGMRSYTLGSAWWQGDCGPYWGHNALLRLEPFIDHCDLPQVPGRPPLGGWILSHDQVEAALMRRAGYEVRVLPVEEGSWEENPPTLIEYIRRDLRWCHGNMQYWQLLAMPGLHPVSRAQLLLAIFMYLGSPFWIVFMTLIMLHIGVSGEAAQLFDPDAGILLFAAIMTMVFAPKLATLVDVLATTEGRRSFGGAPAFSLSFLGEVLFSILLAPVMALAHTRLILGLPLGRAVVWSAQRRRGHRVRLVEGIRRLWPQTLFGASAVAWLYLAAPNALLGFLPFFLGSVLAVPIAVVTSSGRLGIFLANLGLWRIPDEIRPTHELLALHLPTLAPVGNGLASADPVAETASGP